MPVYSSACSSGEGRAEPAYVVTTALSYIQGWRQYLHRRPRTCYPVHTD